MARNSNLLCTFTLAAWSLAGCRADPTSDDAPAFDTATGVTTPACRGASDRPPDNHEVWTLESPATADVVAGIRPAASWQGLAATLISGPAGVCDPCTFVGNGFTPLLLPAADLALELELGCGADAAPQSRAHGIAGLKLRLVGPDYVLPDGSWTALDIEASPLFLTTFDTLGDACVADGTAGGQQIASRRKDGMLLQPGKLLNYRIPFAPILKAAGLDPELPVQHYDVQLQVYSAGGGTAWIELGRTILDGCP